MGGANSAAMHSGRGRRRVVSSVKGDDVATAVTNRSESEIHAVSRLKYAKDSHVRQHGSSQDVLYTHRCPDARAQCFRTRVRVCT